MKKKSQISQRAEYLGFRLLQRLLASASPGATDRWADRLARLVLRVNRKRTKRATANVAATFPERSAAEHEAIVLESLRRFLAMSLEYVGRLHAPAEELDALCRMEGEEILRGALARGRGVILVTAHYGPWEFGAPLLARFGVDVTVVARFLDNKLLERELFAARVRAGITLVDRRRAARAVISTLRRNGMVVVLADQAVQPREGVLVPFLGRPAWTTSAPARLALSEGCAIVFVFGLPGDEVVFEVDSAMFVDELPPEGRTVEAVTTKINDVISRRIMERPELWFWQHDRWKGKVGSGKVEVGSEEWSKE